MVSFIIKSITLFFLSAQLAQTRAPFITFQAHDHPKNIRGRGWTRDTLRLFNGTVAEEDRDYPVQKRDTYSPIIRVQIEPEQKACEWIAQQFKDPIVQEKLANRSGEWERFNQTYRIKSKPLTNVKYALNPFTCFLFGFYLN